MLFCHLSNRVGETPSPKDQKGAEMAIYRLERKSISRVKGHNLVAAVAYRAGLELTDPNLLNPKATTYDYSKKTDVAHTEIMLPDELAAYMNDAGLTLSLPEIANLVEKGETTLRGKMKMGAKLANEYVLAGSHELSLEENIKDFQEFAKQQAEEQGVIAMVFVHDPKQGNDMNEIGDSDPIKKDERNIHAHIVLLSRQVELKNGKLVLGKKCDSDVSNDERVRPVVPQHLVGKIDPVTGKRIQQGRGLCSNSDWLKGVRESWANIQNKSLAHHNLALVTHKSYEDLGINFKPGHHLGKIANHLDKMGKKSYLGKKNDSINDNNRKHSEYAANSQTDISEQRISDSKQRIDYHEQQAAEIDSIIASRAGATDPFADAIRRSRAARESAAISYDRETGAFDEAADETNRKLQKYSGLGNKWVKQREHVVTGYAGEAELLNRRLLHKITKRKDSNNRIRWESYESADDPTHSKKFDRRQQDRLETFATEHNLDRLSHEDHSDFDQRHRLLANNLSFFRDNADILAIVRNAEKEREEHNAKMLSESRQGVLTENSKSSASESSKDLDKATNEFLMGNNVPTLRI